MPGYIQKALTWFKHPSPQIPQHQPYPHVPLKYGQKWWLIEPEDTAPHLDKKDTNLLLELTGMCLFYAWAIDSTILPAISATATKQANKPNNNHIKKDNAILDYAMTHDKSIMMQHGSNMILAMHSNASYLSEPWACSRAMKIFHVHWCHLPPKHWWHP